MKLKRKVKTHLYLLILFFLLFVFPTIFHTGKITRSKAFGIPRHDKTYYVKRSCKGAFYGQCFIIYFFIQLVSHHTQIRTHQSDMEWLQFHLIATQTAQNHIIFVYYSISKERKNYIPTLNNWWDPWHVKLMYRQCSCHKVV